MTDFALSRPLQIGKILSQSEVENVFNTDFGYQFRGITLPGRLHRAQSPRHRRRVRA